jgi:hypothetical protein
MRALAPALHKQAACFTHSVRPVRAQRLQRVGMSAVAKQVISTDQAPAALGPYSQVLTKLHQQPPASSTTVIY